jgi:hypothetical protein
MGNRLGPLTARARSFGAASDVVLSVIELVDVEVKTVDVHNRPTNTEQPETELLPAEFRATSVPLPAQDPAHS